MSCIFMSVNFMPGHLVRQFHVHQFHAGHFDGPSFSCPSFSAPPLNVAWWLSGYGVGFGTERSQVRLPAAALPSNKVNSAFHPSGVGKSTRACTPGVKAGRARLCVAGKTV